MLKSNYDRLVEIREQMEGFLTEIKDILRTDSSYAIYERAKAYWLSGIEHDLSGYSRHDVSMESTLRELESSIIEEDEEEVEEDEEEVEDYDG